MQLLGFPVQLIGVLSLPYFYVKYAVEGDNIVDDIGDAAVSWNCCSLCFKKSVRNCAAMLPTMDLNEMQHVIFLMPKIYSYVFHLEYTSDLAAPAMQWPPFPSEALQAESNL